MKVLLAVFAVACLLALPSLTSAAPTLTVTPSTIQPGQSLHVVATGITASNQAGTTLCVGLFGPGRHVELGLTPAFRPNLGTIAIGTNGTGQADVTTPSDLVVGTYQIVVGGCSPHLDVAPLATTASATINVVTSAATATPAPNPAVAPNRLPATGGTPPFGLVLVAALGGLGLLAGRWVRRKR